jgi:2-polyprenyl-3-methyl-5-hydroxy-6-metoxy-1,4-benzoquinol methylase
VPVVATFDLERIIPERLSDDPVDRETLEIHAARYAFAARRVAGKRVLDLACGVGYGSAMLKAAGAAHVTGVDVSDEAVAYARAHNAADGIAFVCSDGMTYAPDAAFDVVVSLETIEHVPDARGFVRRLAGLVAPGGVLVGSVPTTLSTDINPYHLHDFSADEFRALIRANGLSIVDEMTQTQRYSPLAHRRLARTSQRKYQLRAGLTRYYATHPRMLLRRLWTTAVHGFANKYLVLVGKKP